MQASGATKFNAKSESDMTIEDKAIAIASHYFRGGSSEHDDLVAEIAAFARNQVLQERIECASIANLLQDHGYACGAIANAIRARPQP